MDKTQKRAANFLNKLLIIVVLLSLAGNNVLPLVSDLFYTETVMATSNNEESETDTDEEDSDTDDDSDDSGSGAEVNLEDIANVYADENRDAVGGFESASAYNPAVHYLVTYNVLDSKLNQVSNNSPYSKIPNGNINNAFSGPIGEAVANHLEEPNTDAFEYIDSLVAETDVDVDYNDNDVQDAIEQYPEETIIDTGEQSGIADEASKELINIMTSELLKVYDGKLTLKSTGGAVESKTAKVGSTTYQPGEKNVVVVQFGNGQTPFATLGENRTKDLLQQAIKASLESLQSRGRLGSVSLSEMPDVIAEDVQTWIIDWGKKNGVLDSSYNAGQSGIMKRVNLQSDGLTYVEYNVSNRYKSGGILGANANNVMVVPATNTFSGEFKMNTEAVMALQLKRAMDVIDEKDLQSYKTASEQFKTNIESSNAYKNYKQRVTDAEVGTRGYGLVTWTTLAPTFSEEADSGDITQTNELLENFDGSKVSGRTLETSSGDERFILSGDLFLTKTDYSPVIVGGNTGMFSTSTSGHTMIDVGKSASGLGSGVVNTAELLGTKHQMQSKWNLRDSSTEIVFLDELVDNGNTSYQSYFNSTGDTNTHRGTAMVHAMLTGQPSIWGSEFNKTLTGQTEVLGVDNYGNIIGGTNGAVLVPYWQNPYFAPLNTINGGVNDQKMLGSTPMFSSEIDNANLFNNLYAQLSGYAMTEKTVNNYSAIIGSDDAAKTEIDKVRNALSTNLDSASISSALKNGVGGVSAEDTKKALAVIIASDTMDEVESFNAQMIEAARLAGRLYISNEPGALDQDSDGNSRGNQEAYRWTAASLIQKIGYLFDYGIYETIQLTASRTTASFYNNTVKNSGMTQIFYTDTMLDNGTGSYYMILVASILASVLVVYIVWSAFRALRGVAVLKQVLLQFFVVAFAVAIPTSIYQPLTHYVLNKPAQVFLNDQMKGIVVLDTYLANDTIKKDINEYYGNMFGRTEATSELSTGNYYLQFPTSMDKAGFDINMERWSNSDLSYPQMRRLRRYQEEAIPYPENDMVMVNVALVDLYKWVWDQSGLGPTGEVVENTEELEEFTDEDGITYYIDENGERVRRNEYTEAVVETEINDFSEITPLFQWLAEGGGGKYKVTGYSADLATYDEYSENLFMPFVYRYPSVKDQLRQAGAGSGGLLGWLTQSFRILQENLSWNLGQNHTPITTASQLFYETVVHMSMGDVSTNIGKLYDFARLVNAVRIDGGVASYHYIPSPQETQSVLRDLSSISERRHENYGTTGWAPMSRVVIDVPNPLEVNDIRNFYVNDARINSANDAMDQTDSEGGVQAGGIWELPINPSFVAPEEDFLNITPLIRRILPDQARGALSMSNTSGPGMRNKTLAGDIYDINYGTLTQYINNYYITRASMGSTRNQEALNHAEQMVMATEVYFQINNTLKINAFPKGFYVGGITFDKYLSMLFIPLIDYGEATLNFYEYDAVIPRSAAEYVSMNSNMLEFIVFIIAVAVVAIFGMLYIAVFYFLMLFLIMYNFIKHYVIRADFSNKSWLGVLFIYGSFGLSKAALVFVWGVLTNAMNRSAAQSLAGIPSYPFVAMNGLVIAVFTGGLLWFLISKVLSGVFNDMDNLGGEYFSNAVRNIAGKMSGKATGEFKATNKSGSSVKKAAENEGQNGNLRGRNNLNSALAMGGVGLMASSAARLGEAGVVTSNAVKSAASEVDSKVRDGEINFMNTGRSSYKSMHGIPESKIQLERGSAHNDASHRVFYKQAKKVNSISETVGGIAEQALAGAATGAVLASTANSAVTTMAMGTAQAAEVVAAGLVAKGVRAVASGKNVHFNSTGYNLGDKAVRAELFRGSVNNLQQAYTKSVAEVDEENIEYVLPFSIKNSRTGTAEVRFGKEGLSGTTYDRLVQSPEFRKYFIPPKPTSRNIAPDGTIMGKMDLQFKNPRLSSREKYEALTALHRVDDELRVSNNLEERTGNNYNTRINFSQLSKTQRENIEEIARGRNMLMQGNSVYYDRENQAQSSVVQQLQDEYRGINENLSESLQVPSTNLMNYIQKGGKKGVAVKTMDPRDNKAVAATASVFAGQEIRKGIEKIKVTNDKTELEQIIQKRNDLHDLSEYATQTAVGRQQVAKFQETKDAVNNLALSSLSQTLANGNYDTTRYNHAVEQHLEQTRLGNTAGYKGLKAQREELDTLYKRNRISEDEYFKNQERLSTAYRSFMEDTGYADAFSLGVVKSSAKGEGRDLHTRYFSEMEQLQQEVGIENRDSLMQTRTNHLVTNSKLIRDKGALQVRDGVASISYTENDLNNNVGVDGSQGAVESYVLGTNAHKDYRSGTVQNFFNKVNGKPVQYDVEDNYDVNNQTTNYNQSSTSNTTNVVPVFNKDEEKRDKRMDELTEQRRDIGKSSPAKKKPKKEEKEETKRTRSSVTREGSADTGTGSRTDRLRGRTPTQPLDDPVNIPEVRETLETRQPTEESAPDTPTNKEPETQRSRREGEPIDQELSDKVRDVYGLTDE